MTNLFVYGQSGSGKDTLSNYFRDKHNYLKFRCAGTIKQVLSEMNDLTAKELEEKKRNDEELRKAHWKFGDWYNRGNDHLSVLTRLKNILNHESIEFDSIPQLIRNNPVIISDVRIEKEMRYLLSHDCVGIFLTRKTKEFKKNLHATEHDLFSEGIIQKITNEYPGQCIIVFNDIVSEDEEKELLEEVNNYPNALRVILATNADANQLINSFHHNLLEIMPFFMQGFRR